MQMAWHWVREYRGAEWHVWRGLRSGSLCGVLRRPVVRAAVVAGTAEITAASPEGEICPACHGLSAWLRVIGFKLAAMRVGVVCEADQLRLAAYLVSVGPPESSEGRAAWARVQSSVLRPSTRTVAVGKQVRRCWALKPALAVLGAHGGRV